MVQVTGSCARRRHWSRLRACTTRAVAAAGIAAGAWLLGTGVAAAEPERLPDVSAQVQEAMPDIAARTEAAQPDEIEIAEPRSPEVEQVRVEEPDVQLATAVQEPIDASLGEEVTAPARDAEQADEPVSPDNSAPPATTSLTPQKPSPNAEVPVPAPPRAVAPRPAEQHIGHADSAWSPPDAVQTPEAHHEAPPEPSPVPPPPAPSTITAPTSSAPGHELRGPHAVLPAQVRLSGPARAAGGHAEPPALRGIALVEPSAAPD